MFKRSLVTLLSTLLLSPAAVADEGVSVTKDLEYSTAPALLLDVYAPEAITDDMPLVVFVLSSGSGRYDHGMKDAFGTAGKVLAAYGQIWVIPDHRLAPDVLFPNFVEDFARAVRWAHDRFPTATGGARPLIIGGEGTGAYVAAMTALDERYLATAGVPAGAVTGFIGQSGTYLGGDDCRRRQCARYFPDDRSADWAAPDLVDMEDPPMLLIAGEKDESEGIDELEELAGPAARARVEVTTLVVPRSNGLSLFIDLARPGTSVHETVRGFVDRLSAR